MKIRTALASLTISLIALGLSAAPRPREGALRASGSIAAGRAYGTVEALSSSECAGRLTGTPGYARAARWVEEELRRAGAAPPPGEKGYLQPFPVTVHALESARLELLSSGEATPRAEEAKMGEEYMPMLASDTCEAEAEVLFAGYGISDAGGGRDDYAGLEVEGKVVMVLRGVPEDGRDWTGRSDTRAKASVARAHGAVAMLLVDRPVMSVHDARVAGLGLAMVGEPLADRLLEGRGLKVAELRKVLARGGVSSFPTGQRVRISFRAREPKPAEGFNVLGFLPGRDRERPADYVLVCGHLDHVGDWPSLHPGANDNASGAAAVLEVARAFAGLRRPPERGLLVAFLGGEEMGLLGAKHLAANLPAGLGRCIAVFNMDMVGQGTGAWVGGGKTFPGLMAALEAARDQVAPGMRLEGGASKGEARADHRPFQDAGIPAVSLFGAWGVSHGYHTPEDTLFWLTPKSVEAIARTVFLAAFAVADAPGETGAMSGPKP